MSWYHKEIQTQFEITPIDGLFFLDGDLIAREIGRDWTKGMKYPMVEFPSGTAFELWEIGAAVHTDILHLFGEMDVLLTSSRDEAFKTAREIAELVGYIALLHGDSQLELVGHDEGEHLLLTFDNERRTIVDVAQVIGQDNEHPQAELLDAANRAKLPPLHSGEALGLNALAQVKFFTPDSNWTWYASEGSPIDANSYMDTEDEKVDFLFFGLVIGFEIEFGYFSLAELSSVRGGLGLPIERDKFFQPTTLRELKAKHEQERRT
jgi:hypothetical protein